MYDPRRHNRQSIRLKGYDYSRPGYYFITICVSERYQLFGKVCDGRVNLNMYGKIAEKEWLRTENMRDNVRLDEFIVMPDHLHGIIGITNQNEDRGVSQYAPTQNKFQSPSNNVGSIIRGYKSAVTRQINQLNKQPGDKVWQRNYHDYIIRNRIELNRIRRYIRDNPKNWEIEEQ